MVASKFTLTIFFSTLFCACASQHRSVVIKPIAGATTREEYKSYGGGSLVTPEKLLKNLDGIPKSIQNFVEFSKTVDEKKILATYSSWDVRGKDLQDIVSRVATRMPQPTRVVAMEDSLGYQRIAAIWQEPGFYKALRIAENNDNTTVTLVAGKGPFKPEGLKVRKELPPQANLVQTASFLKSDKSIYPHIEEYSVCSPACD